MSRKIYLSFGCSFTFSPHPPTPKKKYSEKKIIIQYNILHIKYYCVTSHLYILYSASAKKERYIT